ncbi:hypothetical protein CYMTET_3633 [Cymbomonas tetramitiformis]|uniref:NADP-dependent oxidoreductase domain-containing protein n=1 Tax=Cymbomonas tetramitiformis TaxID=36881 RepID=A0AAE0H2V1_9CHLO|nr:hypothetical protein CYMTET_3633 [Cymbomonas tetramitiformis]
MSRAIFRISLLTHVLLVAGQRPLPVVPNVILSNGVEFPVMSFGANVWDAETTRYSTGFALMAGFRNFFSSVLIGEASQAAQAEVLGNFSRGELFICGTVNTGDGACDGLDDCYAKTKAGALGQFSVLKQDLLDMIMLDYPATGGCESIVGQWKALEELYLANKTRSIAVSNFSPDQIQCIANNPGSTLPHMNQMPYSVGHGDDTVVQDDAKFGTKVQAYSPLDAGALVNDPLCKEIGDKYKRSAAQIALKWVLQRNVSVCTESTSLVYMQMDLDIFSFNLTVDEMQRLNAHKPTARNNVA